MNTLGSETSLAGITREEIIHHFQLHVGPDNIALAMFGDITVEDARALAETYLGTLSGTSVHDTAWTAAQPSLPGRAEESGPFEQAILLVGFPGIDIMDPRNDALNILQRAMSGLSSDLAIEVREKRGLVYFIGALSMSGLQPGLFGFYAGTTAPRIDEVETLIKEQIVRLTREGLRTEEMERARAQLIAGHDMSLQNTGELAQTAALNEVLGLGYAYTFNLPERLLAVTPEDIRSAAESLFQAGDTAVSRILPAVSP
jgi:zinc protease